MVMKYILFSAGETVVKIGAMKLVEHFAGKNQIQDLEKEKLEAMRAATAQQLQALSILQQQPFAVPTGPVGIPAPVAVSVATEASKPCPACTLYEETSLARSYSETIVRHCGEGEVIPRGYGGTVLQVREHLERAAMAAEALREKPQFAQPGQMIAQGLRGLIKGLEGQGVTCAQVRQVLPSLQEAEGVADRIAVLWWQKLEGSGSSQAPQGRT